MSVDNASLALAVPAAAEAASPKVSSKGKGRAPRAEVAAEPDVLDQMAKLRNILGKKRAGEDADDSESEGETYRSPHNRGNKLKRYAPGAEPGTRASAERLWAAHHDDGFLEHVVIGKKRCIVRKPARRQKIARFDRDDDPYDKIKPSRILQPPVDPDDLLSRKDAIRCFRSHELLAMERNAMAIVEQEAALNRMLKRATYMVQREDDATANIRFGADYVLSSGSGPSADEAKAEPTEADADGRSEEEKAQEEEEVWTEARDLLQAAVASSNEVILRLTAARSRLARAHSQKDYLRKKLQEIGLFHRPEGE